MLQSEWRSHFDGGRSEHARVWSLATGSELASTDHFFFPQCPAPFPQFSPTGEQITTLRLYYASLRTVESTNLPSFARLAHESFLTGASYSPDGQHIATVSVDSSARLWDTRTGEAFLSPLRHDGEVFMARFSQDGLRLVTSSRDKSARLWDARNGQALGEPMRHEQNVLMAKLGTGGQRVVTLSESDQAWLWDVRTVQPTVLCWLSIPAKFVSFSADGQKLLVVDEGDGTRVCNASSGIFQTGFVWPQKRCITADAHFSPDGRHFVTASEDISQDPQDPYGGVAQVFDALAAKLIGRSFRHRKYIGQVRFSPDGKGLATASDDGTAGLWDVESSQQKFTVRHSGPVVDVEFSPDGKLIATASVDRTAALSDSGTGRPVTKPLQHDADVLWLAFDSRGERLATASKDKTVRIWSVQTGEMLTPPLVHADALNLHHSVTFSPDGSRLAAAAGSSAQVWDSKTGAALTPQLRHGGLVQTVQFSPDGSKLLTASDDGSARLWDTQTGHPVSESLKHGSRVTAAEFSPDGSKVVTCSSDKSIRIWQVTSAPLPVPSWLPVVGEAIAGQRIDAKDVSGVVPVEELYRLRQELAKDTTSSYYDRWARWFFAESASRTISPSSNITIPEYVNRRVEENTLESLEEATRLCATNAPGL